MILLPGDLATIDDLAAAEELQDLSATEFDRVRKAAENWRNGLAGLLGLLTTVSVVKGNDVVSELSRRDQWIVAGLALTALVLGSSGAFLAMRAAFGIPRARQSQGIRRFRRQETFEALRDLRLAIFLTFATLAAMTASVGMTWLGTVPKQSFVVVDSDQRQECGRTATSDGKTLILDGVRGSSHVPLREVRRISSTGACP